MYTKGTMLYVRGLLFPALVAAATLLLAGCFSMDSTSVDEESYLAPGLHPESIYKTSADKEGNERVDGGFLPFLNGEIDRMERLAVVDIEGDPHYSCIELQLFDSPKKQGAIVIAYRHDGGADMYHSPGFFLIPADEGNDTLLNSTSYYERRVRYRFDVDSSRANIAGEFRDRFDREIRFSIGMAGLDASTAILAPVGGGTVDPAFFPFVYLEEFVIARGKAEIEVTVDGVPRSIRKIPSLFSPTYLCRYSTRPVVGFWMQEQKQVLLSVLPVTPTAGEATERSVATVNGMVYHLEHRSGRTGIASVEIAAGDMVQLLRFAPALPDFEAMRNDTQASGRFSASSGDYRGVFAGEYEVEKAKEVIKIKLLPKEGWQPFPGPLWVRSYRWDVTITPAESGKYRVNSSWTR